MNSCCVYGIIIPILFSLGIILNISFKISTLKYILLSINNDHSESNGVIEFTNLFRIFVKLTNLS